MIFAARWILPIDGPPIRDGWVEVSRGTIRAVGQGRIPRARDLGEVAVLPGLVNAHTHLELSWMAGLVPPAESMHAWIGSVLDRRRAGPTGGTVTVVEAARAALATAKASGTVLVGDVSNTLSTVACLSEAGIGGVVFHELLGFDVHEARLLVQEADERLRRALASADRKTAGSRLRGRVVAHAPYSVSPELFRAVAAHDGDGPLAVHVGESLEEIEFLRTGGGPIRQTLETLGRWVPGWEAPRTHPVAYLARLGYLEPGLLAVHATHLDDRALDALKAAEAVVVTCPRSNAWVGAGVPRVSHFYAAGVPVAIGTDSLASVASLSMFDELAALRRIAPDVAAATLLESATRVGAHALGFGDTHGTIRPGKTAALIAVDVPEGERDVEEYLVGGIAPSAVRVLP